MYPWAEAKQEGVAKHYIIDGHYITVRYRMIHALNNYMIVLYTRERERVVLVCSWEMAGVALGEVGWVEEGAVLA